MKNNINPTVCAEYDDETDGYDVEMLFAFYANVLVAHRGVSPKSECLCRVGAGDRDTTRGRKLCKLYLKWRFLFTELCCSA